MTERYSIKIINYAKSTTRVYPRDSGKQWLKTNQSRDHFSSLIMRIQRVEFYESKRRRNIKQTSQDEILFGGYFSKKPFFHQRIGNPFEY